MAQAQAQAPAATGLQRGRAVPAHPPSRMPASKAPGGAEACAIVCRTAQSGLWLQGHARRCLCRQKGCRKQGAGGLQQRTGAVPAARGSRRQGGAEVPGEGLPGHGLR